jgi:benzodiazapine receptor
MGDGFYESLNKPAWIPPDWAFPAAWFTLWTLQAVAAARLLASDSPHRSLALGLMVAQFATAIAWQAAVFGPGRLLLAAWWLTGVLALVTVATIAAARCDRWAGALVAPTIVWMTVATALGWSLHRRNPSA